MTWFFPQKKSMDQIGVAWQRQLLQILLLRHQIASVHGDHSDASLLKQMRFLLATRDKPRGHDLVCGATTLPFPLPFPPIKLIDETGDGRLTRRKKSSKGW